MQASEGRLGRVFLLHLEEGDDTVRAIENFAAENGVLAAQVFALSGSALAGILAADSNGAPRLRLAGGEAWPGGGEAVVQEIIGLTLRRVRDPVSGRETLTKTSSSRTRLMEKAAPAPEPAGPGSVPVYLFNAEFN